MLTRQMKDFYYILGTARNAAAPEIEAAYHKLARKFGQAAEDERDEFMDSHFREITEAYDILRDEHRRRKYDVAFLNNQKHHLSVLKLKHINIAVTFIFLLLTALLARYVIIASTTHAAKKIIPKLTAQPAKFTAIPHPKKHYRQPPIVSADIITSKPIPASDTVTGQTNRVIKQVINPPIIDSTYITQLHANITGIVYLHQYAGYRSAVLAKLPGSAQVKVLQKGPAWYKVAYNDTVGYVLKSSLQKP